MTTTNFITVEGLAKAKEQLYLHLKFKSNLDFITERAIQQIRRRKQMVRTVTEKQVMEKIVNIEVKTVELVGKKHTLVAVRLVNGFTIIETSTAVDVNNYNEEVGKKVCMDRILNKIWLLEGYLLQEEMYQKEITE